MTPDDYCRQRVAATGSSLYYSVLFIEPEQRQAITALHALRREFEDTLNATSDPHLARTKLAWWRGEVAALYAGQPSHPATQALAHAILRFPLPREQMLELIDGMEMNIDTRSYPDFRALRLYCYRAGSIVSLLSAEILGYRDRHTLKYAHELGLAFELTRIIRDVGKDVRHGRIYLPQEELAQFGVDPAELRQASHTDNFRRLMEFQIARAEATYAQALARLPGDDRKSQRAGLVLAAIDRALLKEIARDDCQVLHQRIDLTPLRKFWLTSKTWIGT
ncbi:MAG: squalene synthase HpnD [Betaproteobacteria bacterium HGW-Betaproteobacteria-11]|nr:MAG: squalene synthase HpnD [Betaproteobacteria bacterium HGW-Betaproteobacteria-11]